MLKADLHIHVKGDKQDNIRYTAHQLIDRASELKYEILAITCHDVVIYSQELAAYAASKGILLIPGAEKTLNGKHVLLYNLTNEELDAIGTFDDLRELKKKKKILVIAPHPYFLTPFCLGKELEKNIDLFDALEYSHYHTTFINFNRKAVKLAKKHHKPIVGNSDTHDLLRCTTTYSLIDSTKNTEAVISAVKSGNVQCVSSPLPLKDFMRITCWSFISFLKKIILRP